MPVPNGGENFVWIGLPGEGSQVLVMFLDEATDGSLKINDGMKDAVLQAVLVTLAKKPSTALSHSQRVGTK